MINAPRNCIFCKSDLTNAIFDTNLIVLECGDHQAFSIGYEGNSYWLRLNLNDEIDMVGFVINGIEVVTSKETKITIMDDFKQITTGFINWDFSSVESLEKQVKLALTFI